MFKWKIFFVLCLFAQVWTQEMTGSFYNPFLSYNYPYLRYPRRAQSVYDITPKWSNPAYDVTPPRRSQPAYDTSPPVRSQPAYDTSPPVRSQPAYDTSPPVRSQPAYDTSPPVRSQPAYDTSPPVRSQPAYDTSPPVRSQPAYDTSPPVRSQPAYDTSPPVRSQPAYDTSPPVRSQPAYDTSPPVRSQPAYDTSPPVRSQPAYDTSPPVRSQPAYDTSPPVRSQPAYDTSPPVRSQPAYDTSPSRHSKFGVHLEQSYNSPFSQHIVIGSAPTSDIERPAHPERPVAPDAPKSPSAYWVEPYIGNAKTPLDDTSITLKDASGFEQPNPISDSRGGSIVRDDEPKCILPPLPEHGIYVKNDANPTQRLGSEIVTLNVTCDAGYIIHGASTVHCYNGVWADDMPKCLPVTCPLKPHHSVEYRCLVIGDVVGSRACLAEEPVGTMVSPRCRKPHFYSTSNSLAFMHCGEDGTWDHVAKCTPECGTVTASGHGLVVGGQDAKRGEFPWHVGVYLKRYMPYMQACGGTLISNKLIISAAHCFWDDLQKQLPASDYAVAVGKLYRPWDDKMDESQKSDVKEIHMPPRFQGASSNFQDDIAVVIPAVAFEYKIHVRPVCLSFDSHFDRLQLQTVNKGKVAGWGLTAADGKASSVLQVLELPYVEVGTCIAHSPPTFVAHITSDKICAGDRNTTTALCRGDSGGGLTFVATDRVTPRYYLRGIVSTAPSDQHDCNTHTYTSFTHVQKHGDFIKQFITEA